MNNQTKMAKFKKAYRKKWKHVIYIMPILIWWFIIAIYPRLEIFPMSLYEWNPVTNHKEFVGLYYLQRQLYSKWALCTQEWANQAF